MVGLKKKYSTVQVSPELLATLRDLKRATGLPTATIVAMAVDDWQKRRCGPGTEAGRVLLAITRQQRGVQ
jgi:hypothetical protein